MSFSSWGSQSILMSWMYYKILVHHKLSFSCMTNYYLPIFASSLFSSFWLCSCFGGCLSVFPSPPSITIGAVMFNVLLIFLRIITRSFFGLKSGLINEDPKSLKVLELWFSDISLSKGGGLFHYEIVSVKISCLPSILIEIGLSFATSYLNSSDNISFEPSFSRSRVDFEPPFPFTSMIFLKASLSPSLSESRFSSTYPFFILRS